METLADSLLYYSIYLNAPGLWASVQKEYLVASRDDPMWTVSVGTEMSVQ